MVINFVVLVLLLILSAFFSGSETAFSAANRIKLKNLADDGSKAAARALKLMDRYDKLLATILIGNNIVNIAASAIATVTAAQISDSNWAVTIGTIILTIVVLIFSEITPKSMAKESAERFAMFSAPFMGFLMVIMTPLSLCMGGIKKLLAKLIKPRQVDSEIEDELITFVEEAENEGNLGSDESDLIRNAIEFNDIEAEEILTPRVDVVAVDINDDRESVTEAFYRSGHTRLPVYEGTIDNIIGVLNIKDFTDPENSGKPLSGMMSQPIMIVPSTKISKLLSLLRQKKSHMAVLVDEFGGTMGIVTMEDVLEELVGEIWDEHDVVVQDITEEADGSLRVLGSASLRDMLERFDMEVPEEDTEAVSVAGWITEQLGKIPSAGDGFDYEDLHVEVTKCDARHVEEALVTRKEKETEEGADDDE